MADVTGDWKRVAPTLYRHRWVFALLYVVYAAVVVWQSVAARAWAHARESNAMIGRSPTWAFWVMTGLACLFPLAFVGPAWWRRTAVAASCVGFLVCLVAS